MKRSSLWIVLLLLCPGLSHAEGATFAGQQQEMDTVWLITAGALVFFMQAGFALLESGMARSKNSVNVLMKNYMDLCLGSLAFWVVGYGLMFGNNPTGLAGETHFLLGNAEHMDYSLLFFQTMFAATAVTIASGAMAERTRYGAYLIGATIICGFIYPVYGSWVWGSLYEGTGWLSELGFIDFAGSTVVHSVGGWVALAGIIVLGPRLGRYDDKNQSRLIAGHSLNNVALGGFILWLGWFGFNAGSTASAELRIGLIALNTHLAAAAGAVGSLISMWILRKPILLTNTINGGIGGLVAITAGCATMEPMYAVITGLAAGWVVVVGNGLMDRLRLDDVVGAVPVHGFAGAWGTLAAGMFVTGDLFNPTQILVQVVGILAAFAWTFPVALLMYGIINITVGLRASTVDEQRGLDYSEHYEIAYPEFQSGLLHQGKN
jgi:Amt family ammonium transporter